MIVVWTVPGRAGLLFELLSSLRTAAEVQSEQLGRPFRPLIVISVHGGPKPPEHISGDGPFGQLFHVINQICWTPSVLLWEPGKAEVKYKDVLNATTRTTAGDFYPSLHRA